MTDKRFWRITPTVLNALSDIHAESNSTLPSKNGASNKVYNFVDEAPIMI